MIHRSIVAILALVFLAAGRSAAAQGNDTWILVNTGNLTLTVLEGSTVRRTYKKISIGRAGTTTDKKQGDDKTPLGEFRLVRIAPKTPYHRFFGLDYPTVGHAERALQAGTIDQEHYAAIRRAFQAGDIPPQATPLGGYLGIHGVGEGDPAIHADFNWTHGCISLTNQQIDDLSNWIHIGMRVVVH
jgi:lipoprotein-anchoring transpeptidase ErfK/SrfK